MTAYEITKPSHYANKSYGIECKELNRNLDFFSGSAFKYAWRFEDKGTPLKDLNKCLFYVNECIEHGFMKRETLDGIEKILIVKENDKYGTLLYDIYMGFFINAKNELIKMIREIN